MIDALDMLEDTGSDVNLSEITRLCDDLDSKQRAYEQAEEQLKLLKAEIDKYESVLIPEKLGKLEELKLAPSEGWPNGRVIKIKRIIRANIKEIDRDVAFAWMDKQGHGSLIKAEVAINFGRSELDQARKLLAELTEKNLPAELKQSVHWQTLASWVKEGLDKGMEFPQFIGIFEGKKIEVKNGK